MKEFIVKYWVEFGFSIIVTGFGLFTKKLSKKMSEQDSIKMGLRAILRDRIIQSYEKYVDKGFYPIHVREGVDLMYREYHNLGGNGVVDKLIEKLNELPTKLNGDD